MRAGLALYPLKRWILALDIDVLENNSTSIIGLEQRMISFGTEYRIPIGSLFDLALRTGLWTNLAQNPNDSLAWTGGLGLRIGGFHLDVAVGSALDSSDIETDVGETEVLPEPPQCGPTARSGCTTSRPGIPREPGRAVSSGFARRALHRVATRTRPANSSMPKGLWRKLRSLTEPPRSLSTSSV